MFDRLTNQRRRLLVANNETLRMALRYLAKLPSSSPDASNETLEEEKKLRERVRLYAKFKLTSLPHRTAPSQLNRKCILTGRGRGVVSGYDLSRIEFRRLALDGRLDGVQKASW